MTSPFGGYEVASATSDIDRLLMRAEGCRSLLETLLRSLMDRGFVWELQGPPDEILVYRELTGGGRLLVWRVPSPFQQLFAHHLSDDGES